eukprot:CAMPEP_0173250566 /NCGR_PEP_ID=MMETSP1142-20121109/19653_1 /TAXON_ID=483371 /ORGANISM="non described non described, Strain CCMP2298" /LENGTH=149 /DNA_ID=CAMNT_0014183333 /DNA_START=31 /DNA_END=476 /DNA_ORIENTATION=-
MGEKTVWGKPARRRKICTALSQLRVERATRILALPAAERISIRWVRRTIRSQPAISSSSITCMALSLCSAGSLLIIRTMSSVGCFIRPLRLYMAAKSIALGSVSVPSMSNMIPSRPPLSVSELSEVPEANILVEVAVIRALLGTCLARS